MIFYEGSNKSSKELELKEVSEFLAQNFTTKKDFLENLQESLFLFIKIEVNVFFFHNYYLNFALRGIKFVEKSAIFVKTLLIKLIIVFLELHVVLC